MITSYVRTPETVKVATHDINVAFPSGTIWLDMAMPTPEEAAYVAQTLGVEIPNPEDIREIESSSRLYTDNSNLYLIAPVIIHSETKPLLKDLAFILTPGMVITVRYATPKAIATCAARLSKQPELAATPFDMLCALIDAVTDRLADILETVGSQIDQGGDRVFNQNQHLHSHRLQTDEMQDVLRSIGASGDLVNKARTSLAGLDRLLTFTSATLAEKLNKEQKSSLKTLNRDLRSLIEHAVFLTGEANFLLDATVGVITIQQNKIITMFSVMAVIFMPPTLIASFYGMNFRHMPELAWEWGYPLAFVAMLLSAIIPLAYFRWRKWL